MTTEIPGEDPSRYEENRQKTLVKNYIYSRHRYSSLQPPNYKLPPDLDVDRIVKELTVGENGYVLIPGIFTQEEVELARYVLFVPNELLLAGVVHYKFVNKQGNFTLPHRDRRPICKQILRS